MRPAILLAVLGCAFVSEAAEIPDDGVTIAARFAVIYPEADQAAEETQLSPGSGWLRRPQKTTRKTSSPTGAKKSKASPRQTEKSEATVLPLRRDRPRKETDPPKTRRRQLGW